MKRQAELFFPAEFSDDFPVSLQISEKYGLVGVCRWEVHVCRWK